jgi:hypothetical protein
MSETAFGHPGDRDKGGAGRRGERAPDPAAGAFLGSITIRGRSRDVATARWFVARTLGDRPETDAAVLLTSEAVTNSVIHTSSATVTVMMTETHAGLRLEITDAGAATVPVAYRHCDLREDRRGVFLVQALSVRSGFDAHDGGLTYWFELCPG